jgi:CDP-diacylglycerol--glycerol-3-phosphate 3-phosphatidyltransferase
MNSPSPDENPSITNLRKQWFAIAVLSVAILSGGYALLRFEWQALYATYWLMSSAPAFILLLWMLANGLGQNRHTVSGRLLPTLGAGNLLTITRGALIACLVGFLVSPRPESWIAWLPGVLYTLAALIDLFDGYVARLANQPTCLGELLDLRMDGLGVLIAALLAVRYGQVPAWYILVGLARYLFVTGWWLRERLGRPTYPLSESASRRPFAGAQMGFLAVVLWPLFSPPGTFIAAAAFALPFLVGFARDWFVASGFISRPAVPETYPGQVKRPAVRKIRPLLTQWLPFFLRMLVAALVIDLFLLSINEYSGLLTTSLSMNSSVSGWIVLLMFIFPLLGALLLILGSAGRVAALMILFFVGFHQRFFGLDNLAILIMTGSAAIFFLGTGPFSLWKPEDKVIRRRLGEI